MPAKEVKSIDGNTLGTGYRGKVDWRKHLDKKKEVKSIDGNGTAPAKEVKSIDGNRMTPAKEVKSIDRNGMTPTKEVKSIDGNGMTPAKSPKKVTPRKGRFCLRWIRTFHELLLGATPRPHTLQSLNNMILRTWFMGSQFFSALVLKKLRPQLSAKKEDTPKWAILP